MEQLPAAALLTVTPSAESIRRSGVTISTFNKNSRLIVIYIIQHMLHGMANLKTLGFRLNNCVTRFVTCFNVVNNF